MAISRYLVFFVSLFVLVACGGGGGDGLPLPGNIDPTAQAGSAQMVDEGDTVQLIGIGVDLDGSISSYLWTQTSGPAVTFSDNSISNPTFTAPQVSAQTNLIFNLTVTDDDGATDTDGVIITVNDTNTPPTANAGTDDMVQEGAMYQLNGVGSDADGGVTYSWSQISGPVVVLSDDTLSNPTFTAPMVAVNQELEFMLTVTDSDGATATDNVIITVNNDGGGGGGDNPPTSNAGPVQTVDEGTNVQLAGSGSDAEGPVTYLWTQIAGPVVTLSDATITNPTFVAPDVTAQVILQFRLTVTDSAGQTAIDAVDITVDYINTPPTVSAGPDQTVTAGDNVQLAGSGSDAEGAVIFAWTQNSGTGIVFSNDSAPNPSFTAPSVTSTEVLELMLTVTDSDGMTAMDTVLITVNPAPVDALPTANAGSNQSVNPGDNVQLQGSGSDAEGAVTYLWSQTAGTTVTLSDDTITNPTFTAPQVATQEVLTFMLTVTDSAGQTATSTVNITVGSGTASYLFYSHDLNAVDPATPAAPAFIESAANILDRGFGFTSSAKLLRLGTYNPANNVVTDAHTHALIYANSTDGRLYKVNGLIGGGTMPVQVSNESQADQICLDASSDGPVRGDSANPDDSVYIYAIPAPTTTCAQENYLWKAVRFGMNSTTAPIAAKEPIEELFDPATGAINGWLVHDAGAFRRCDVNFASCTDIAPVTNSVNSIIQTGFNRSLIEIDDQLYVYDIGAGVLSPSRFTTPTNTIITTPVSDGTTVYFGNGQDLYSMPADGSADATVFYNESADVLHRVVLTANKVIYQTGAAGLTANLKAIPKTPGGTPITLATATGDDHIVLLFNNTTYLYYNIQNFNPGSSFAIIPVLAGVVDEDSGNKTETSNAAWVGGALGTTFDYNAGSDFGLYAETMIRADGFDIPATSGGYATATLRSVNAATAVVGVTLGVMPDGEKVSGLNCFAVGPDIICGSANEINPAPTPPAISFQYDVFYLHATTANSLERVTTTPAQSEVLVF